MVTAMLIHMLDERGDLNLLDPISYYIPEYGVNGKRRATIFIYLIVVESLVLIGELP
jgi:CubicO group peptidase (beta-lactamase class C family)